MIIDFNSLIIQLYSCSQDQAIDVNILRSLLIVHKGIRPDLSTFVNLIVGLCNARLPFEALSYWEEMQRLGLNHRDPRVLRALYLGFAAAHKFDKAKYFAEQWQTLYGAVPPSMPTLAMAKTDTAPLPHEPRQVLPPRRRHRSGDPLSSKQALSSVH